MFGRPTITNKKKDEDLMKILGWTVLPLLLGAFVGCKSAEPAPKPDYFAGIISDFSSLQNELKDGVYQIDSVTKSLYRFAAADGDLRPALSDLQGTIVDLESATARIRTLGKEVKVKEAAFESNWSSDISTIESANVRKSAQQGHTDITNAFHKLEKDGEALGNLYREWESKVKLIQSSVEADLSPANQQAMQSKVREVAELTPRLKDGIRAFSTTLESITASMKSAS
jgi:predicted  nucleic acid-binding Zn-ribbon protein